MKTPLSILLTALFALAACAGSPSEEPTTGDDAAMTEAKPADDKPRVDPKDAPTWPQRMFEVARDPKRRAAELQSSSMKAGCLRPKEVPADATSMSSKFVDPTLPIALTFETTGDYPHELSVGLLTFPFPECTPNVLFRCKGVMKDQPLQPEQCEFTK